MSDSSIKLPSKVGEPAWEAAYLLPPQGQWTEEEFFKFHTNRMAELVDGTLEILPMPTWLHQLILEYLFDRIREYLRVEEIGGKVLMAPLPTRLFPGTVREPDLLYVSPEHFPTDIRGYPDKIDLAVENVSGGAEARKRDYIDKRIDYAKAGVAEYWIVDPEQELITVLSLQGDSFLLIGEYSSGQIAKGRFWEGFNIPVDQLLSIGKNQTKPDDV